MLLFEIWALLLFSHFVISEDPAVNEGETVCRECPSADCITLEKLEGGCQACFCGGLLLPDCPNLLCPFDTDPTCISRSTPDGCAECSCSSDINVPDPPIDPVNPIAPVDSVDDNIPLKENNSSDASPDEKLDTISENSPRIVPNTTDSPTNDPANDNIPPNKDDSPGASLDELPKTIPEDSTGIGLNTADSQTDLVDSSPPIDSTNNVPTNENGLLDSSPNKPQASPEDIPNDVTGQNIPNAVDPLINSDIFPEQRPISNADEFPQHIPPHLLDDFPDREYDIEGLLPDPFIEGQEIPFEQPLSQDTPNDPLSGKDSLPFDPLFAEADVRLDGPPTRQSSRPEDSLDNKDSFPSSDPRFPDPPRVPGNSGIQDTISNPETNNDREFIPQQPKNNKDSTADQHFGNDDHTFDGSLGNRSPAVNSRDPLLEEPFKNQDTTYDRNFDVSNPVPGRPFSGLDPTANRYPNNPDETQNPSFNDRNFALNRPFSDRQPASDDHPRNQGKRPGATSNNREPTVDKPFDHDNPTPDEITRSQPSFDVRDPEFNRPFNNRGPISDQFPSIQDETNDRHFGDPTLDHTSNNENFEPEEHIKSQDHVPDHPNRNPGLIPEQPHESHPPTLHSNTPADLPTNRFPSDRETVNRKDPPRSDHEPSFNRNIPERLCNPLPPCQLECQKLDKNGCPVCDCSDYNDVASDPLPEAVQLCPPLPVCPVGCIETLLGGEFDCYDCNCTLPDIGSTGDPEFYDEIPFGPFPSPNFDEIDRRPSFDYPGELPREPGTDRGPLCGESQCQPGCHLCIGRDGCGRCLCGRDSTICPAFPTCSADCIQTLPSGCLTCSCPTVKLDSKLQSDIINKLPANLQPEFVEDLPTTIKERTVLGRTPDYTTSMEVELLPQSLLQEMISEFTEEFIKNLHSALRNQLGTIVISFVSPRLHSQLSSQLIRQAPPELLFRPPSRSRFVVGPVFSPPLVRPPLLTTFQGVRPGFGRPPFVGGSSGIGAVDRTTPPLRHNSFERPQQGISTDPSSPHRPSVRITGNSRRPVDSFGPGFESNRNPFPGNEPFRGHIPVDPNRGRSPNAEPLSTNSFPSQRRTQSPNKLPQSSVQRQNNFREQLINLLQSSILDGLQASSRVQPNFQRRDSFEPFAGRVRVQHK